MKAFAVILEEKSDEAEKDARRRREREARWSAVTEPRDRAPPPTAIPRDCADARPVESLARADALAATAAAAAAKRRVSVKGRGEPPAPSRDFGVDPGMVGDALALWDLCARHADFFRLAPFPFARLAAALCPDRRGVGGDATRIDERRDAHLDAAPRTDGRLDAAPRIDGHRPLAGAEWLATQPGDPELASECLLRDLHVAFLRVIAGDDVEIQPAPVRSHADGGGAAEAIGWPERARRAVEAAAPGRVKDIAFGAARALRTWEISELAPAARLATLTCLASLACDAGAFGAVAKERRGEGADARPVGMDIGGFKYWRLGGPSGHGVVFVEAPGLEPGEPNEPVPAPAKRDVVRTDGARPARDEPAENVSEPNPETDAEPKRSSARRRARPVKYEDEAATFAASADRDPRSDARIAPGPSEKWSWYPSSAVPALVEWLRASRHPDESALADALVEPTPAFDETPGDECDSRDDRDPSAPDAAAAGDESIRFRGGGTATDGYAGLDRPLPRGVSSDGPRALVALRVAALQTLHAFPFWEGIGGGDTRAGTGETVARMAPLAAAARVAVDFDAARRVVTDVESLLFDAGHLVGWRSRRHAWRAALDAARTVPQLALALGDVADACPKDKKRQTMMRDAFQRVGRLLAVAKPPHERIVNPPFLPRIDERVVLTRAGLEAAYARVAEEVGAPSASENPEAAERAGVPPAPRRTPPTLVCEVAFAGYRKGDPTAVGSARGVPHAWYLLRPLVAVAPASAFEASARAERATPPETPTAPFVVARHVFSGMAPDFLLPAAQTEHLLRRPWAVGDEVRKTVVEFADAGGVAEPLREGARRDDAARRRKSTENTRDEDFAAAEMGSNASAKKSSRAKPAGETIRGVVVKTDWWRGAEDSAEGTKRKRKSAMTEEERDRAKSPWIAEPRGALCVRWEAPPRGTEACRAQWGAPAKPGDGTETAGCAWVSPWDVEPDAEEERRRRGEEAAARRRAEQERWLAELRRRRDADGTIEAGSLDGPGSAFEGFARGATRAVRAPPREGFAEALERFHLEHPLGPGKPLKVPVFCREEVDLHRVFAEVQARGGFRAVTERKRWKEVCRALGHDLSGQTSASFAMRQNFERCLLDYEIYLEREEDAGESPETAKRRKT